MLLHIDGEFAIGILKSSLLSKVSSLLSMSRCMSRYEANLGIFVVSFLSISMGYMRSTKLPNLFSERTPLVQRKVKLKERVSSFLFFLRSPYMKSASYKYRNKSERKGAQLLTIGMSTVC